MKLRLLLMVGLALYWCSQTDAQTTKTYPLEISIFNNATLLPGAAKLGVFGWPIHPGLRAGILFPLKQREKRTWFLTAQLAYHYHQYVHHGLQVYSDLGYRHNLSQKFDIEGRLGLGYLHAISAVPSFELVEGNYQKRSNSGRAQATGGATLGLGYQIAPDWRLFLQTQFYLQIPFVREYVPILPNLAFHTGVQLPLTINKGS
ncbi:MAG: hypothetical protein HRU41_41515 [Saprospiraceae bacterium]|nr:hypothetical protein [Saprospiraceae bacterium]